MLVFSLLKDANLQLREDNDMLCVHGPVSDPVLLCERRGRVDDELLGGGVVLSGRLHLDGVVA